MRFGTYYRYLLIKQLKLDNLIRNSDFWLDLGCYDGSILEKIETQQKMGVDLELKRKPDLNLVQASIEYIPFREKFFGIITAFDVLEHVKRDYIVINQVQDKLRKEGIFMLSVPHKKAKIFPKFLKSWIVFHKWRHIRLGYDQKQLRKLFKNGWSLRFISWNNDFSNFLYLSLQFLWKILPGYAKRVTKKIIKRIIEIEFIRTKKYSSNEGHLIIIAKKK